jgi:hypothetical protein
MRFWEKSLRIFKCLCENSSQGVRRIAQQTGLSKSSVHRLTQGQRAGASIACRGSNLLAMRNGFSPRRSYCPTLPTETSFAVRVGVSPRNEEPI